MYWSESGELVTLACEDAFYVLRFSRENFVAALQSGEIEEDGVEAAFETITDINERYVVKIPSTQKSSLTLPQCTHR